jgi:hypothetical protein
MIALIWFVLDVLASPFKSKSRQQQSSPRSTRDDRCGQKFGGSIGGTITMSFGSFHLSISSRPGVYGRPLFRTALVQLCSALPVDRTSTFSLTSWL